MRSDISKKLRYILIALLCSTAWQLCAQDNATPKDSLATSRWKYERRLEHAKTRWMDIIPNLYVMQYAGNIGFISGGVGWDYGKKERWETHAMLGFLPKMVMSDDMLTFTIRESFSPWNVKCNDYITWTPASFNFSLNTVFNSEFWIIETERFPGDYYRFSSKIRFQLGLGGQLNLHFTNYNRIETDRLSFYYELSTYDLAIVSYVPNHHLPLSDIIALGIGVKYKLF